MAKEIESVNAEELGGNIKIFLNDLLKLTDEEILRTRVKLNQTNEYGVDPYEVYCTDPEHVNKNWLLWHKKRRYFAVGQIAICLVKMPDKNWLLTSIQEITKELEVVEDEGGVGYEGVEIEKYRILFGNVTIKHKKTRPQGRKYEEIKDKLEVLSYTPSIIDDENENQIYDAELVESWEVGNNLSNKNNKSPDKKTDWVMKQRRRTNLGNLGEKIVLKFEHKRLCSLGLSALAEKIDHVSETKGDGLGYDISSFNRNGSVLHIEVKTSGNNKELSFYLSENERQTLVNGKDDYAIYYVTDAETENPKIHIIKRELIINGEIALNPEQYHVKAEMNDIKS